MFESTLFKPEILVFLVGGAVACVAIVCTTLAKLHQQSINARLKEQMIAEGMTPDQIEQVLLADGSSTWSKLEKPKARRMAKPQ